MVIGLMIMQVFPKQLLGIFEASDYMLELGIPAIRIISISFVFAGFGIAGSSIFQAFGKGFLSMMVSIVRQLLVLLPVAYLLSLTNHVGMVWWAFPIAEIAALIITVIFLIRVNRNIVQSMDD